MNRAILAAIAKADSIKFLMNGLAKQGIQLQLQKEPSLRRRAETASFMALSLMIAAAVDGAQTVATAPSVPAPLATDALGITKPSWLTVASGAAQEGYDSNIFGVSTNLAGHPDIANVSSWFTTLSTSLTFDLLAPSGAQNGSFLTILTLAYAADYTAYSAVAREDNLRNTLIATVRGKNGPWSLSVNNLLLYVDGSREDQFYNFYNNLGYAPTRERRNQIQERNTSFLRYDAPDWFARAVDSVTYYNLLIDEHEPIGVYKGYANWVNRDNINVGADLGCKLTPDFAFTGGWRIGQQTQARLNYSLVDNDNTYNRALLGFEGRLPSWLEVEAAAGPDFRRYSDGANSGLRGNRHTWFYTQSQLTGKFTAHDALIASNKVWHWVSSAGLYSIQETLDSLTYEHVFTKQFSASAGVNIVGHRYDAPAIRNDWTQSYPVDMTYAFNQYLSVSADFTNTGGHSRLPTVITPGQNFSENLVFLSVKSSF
jgi:hypothetical protein